MSDKYLSMHKKVNGFSFANLGVFYGLGSSIQSTVYSLILMDIFHNSAIVGVYSGIYSALCMLAGLIAGELYRRFPKSKLFYFSILAAGIIAFCMAFPIKAETFIALDLASSLPWVLISMTIPLFLSDFAKDVGLGKLNGRYYFWLNIGALIAPMLAMFIATRFGIRAPLFAVSAVFILGWIYFKLFRIVAEDKKIARVNPRRTFRSILRNIILFFRRPAFVRSYLVTFGSYALVAMRNIYVPLIVIAEGFSKDTLGIILTLGILPYVFLSEPMGRLAKKYGKRSWLITGFLSFAALSFWAAFAHGWTLLVIFVLWQISGALIEPLRDLLFFDAAKKEEKARFIGIYKTSNNIPRFIAPVLGAIAIFAFGATSAVWLIAGLVAILTTVVLIKK